MVLRRQRSRVLRGTLAGMAPTNRKATIQEMATFRVVGGKIVEQRGQPDVNGPRGTYVYSCIIDRHLIAKWASTSLASRRCVVIAALAGVLLALPALHFGFLLDDYHQRAALLDPPATGIGYVTGRGLADLFRFMDGSPERVRPAMEAGVVPWWTDDHARISFYRPLAALTHRVDYALWPDSPVSMHVHSVAWFGILVLMAGAFYRRFLGATAAAGLATLLFAVDDAHATAIAWLSQRNILPATVFGVLVVLAHDRWRRHNSLSAAVIAPALLAAALLSGESGIATLAYLFSYAVFLDDRRDWRARGASLIPALVVIAVWRVAVSIAGFGTENSDFYIDPAAEPLRFGIAVLARAPVLFLGQMSPIPAQAALFSPASAYPVLLTIGVGWMLVLALVMSPLLRRDPAARFFGTGMMLSLVPFCATFPHNRVLVFVGLGAMGLVARFLTHAFAEGARPRLIRIVDGIVAAVLILFRLVWSPINLPAEIRLGTVLDARLSVDYPAADALEGTTVVVVNGPVVFWAGHLPIKRAALRESVPRMRMLGPSMSSMHIERVDARTLLLRPDTGYLSHPFDGLFRSVRTPFLAGSQVDLSDVNIQVTRLTPDGRPAEIAARFRTPLEDRSLRWVQWKDDRYQPWKPPAVGATTDLPPAVLQLPLKADDSAGRR